MSKKYVSQISALLMSAAAAGAMGQPEITQLRVPEKYEY